MTRSGEERVGRYPLLGLIAYVLVPGERRSRAAGHMQRAAIEVARGLRALAVPPGREEKPRSGGASSQKIEIR